MKKFFMLSMFIFFGTSAFAACNTYDLNCDPATGGEIYDLNRGYEQQRDSLSTGHGSWDLNKDSGGSDNWDLNSSNGCATWDLNCE